jgi:sugar/nucleoside kinase (ribokinase family)
MLDIYIQEPDSLNPDTDTEGVTKLIWGGSAANFAVWASRLGLDSCINGRVGPDFLGDAAFADFGKEGVKPFIVRDETAPTGTVVIKSRGADGREMICDRKANAKFCEDDLPSGEILLADWIHISGYTVIEERPRRAVVACIRKALEGKPMISVDPGSCSLIGGLGAGRFLDAVKGAHVILPNFEEAKLLTGLEDPGKMAEALLARFPVVVIKLGSQGALYADRKGSRGKVPAFDAVVRDVNGAGDAFGAAFAACFIHTGDLKRSVEAGCELASLIVGAEGARPEVPVKGIIDKYLTPNRRD